jgi:hypothetical protein
MGKIYKDKPPLGSTINWGHPLSKGLVGCWLMNEGGGGKVFNLARKDIGTFRNLSNVTWKKGIKGNNIDFTGIGANYGQQSISIPDKTVYNLEGSFSIVSLAYAINTDSVSHSYTIILCSKDNQTGARNGWLFGLRGKEDDPNNTKTIFDVVYSSTDHIVYSASKLPYPFAYKWHQFAYTYNNPSTTYCFYRNGKADGTGTGEAVHTPNTMSFEIGGWASGSDYVVEWNGGIAYTYIFNRVLSPQEISQLYSEPYCFIARPSYRSYFYEAPTSGTTTATWWGKVWGSEVTV